MATATPRKTTPARTTRQKAAAAGAAVPQDRAQKAEAKQDTLEIVVDGIELTLDRDVLDDYEAVELMAVGLPTRMFDLICGDRQKEIRKALADDNGRLRASVVGEFVNKVGEAVGQGK